jgi:hypothetical protein
MPLIREKARLLEVRTVSDVGVATLSGAGGIFGKEVVRRPRKIIFRSRRPFMPELKILGF